MCVCVCVCVTGHGLGELNKALAHSLRPGCVKDLSTRGVAATLVLVTTAAQPTHTPTHTETQGGVAGGAVPLDERDVAASKTLEYYNSKVRTSRPSPK